MVPEKGWPTVELGYISVVSARGDMRLSRRDRRRQDRALGVCSVFFFFWF